MTPFRLILLSLALLVAAPAALRAQSRRSAPPTPTPTPSESDERIRVFTEEVRIPVFARDEYGRFDPTLERDDVLVLEDGVPQQVRSIRRTPASVLLVLNTGGELNPGMRTKTTRALALALVGAVRQGDRVAVLQFNRRTELLQDWTTDLEAVRHALLTRLSGSSGARHTEALTRAAKLFAEEAQGNRHVVLVTDGVETEGGAGAREQEKTITESAVLGGRAGYAAAYKQLQASGVTIHVVSYGTLGRKVSKEKKDSAPTAAGGVPGSVQATGVSRAGIDPTRPPTQGGGGGMGPLPGAGTISFDPAMKRLRKAYERAIARGEEQMVALTAETGGRIYRPVTDEEMIAQGAEVAREIGTQYVVTYAPKRPLAEGSSTEYRRIQVVARRGGLSLRARRGYVAAAMQNRPVPGDREPR
jgi:VWFA-related protein